MKMAVVDFFFSHSFSVFSPDDFLLFFLISAPPDSTTVPLLDESLNNNEVEQRKLLSQKSTFGMCPLIKGTFFLFKNKSEK